MIYFQRNISDVVSSRNERELNDRLEALEKHIDQIDPIILLKLDKLNQTYLHLALLFPFKEHKNDKKLSEKIAFELTNLLLNKMKQRLKKEDFQNKILKLRPKNGFMLLHRAFMTGSKRIFERVLRELKEPGFKEILKANLANYTHGGYGILNDIRYASVDIVRCLLRELKKPGFEEILKANLSYRTLDGFTVLSGALKSASADVFEIILRELKEPGLEEVLKASLANCVEDSIALKDAIESGSVHKISMIFDEFKKQGLEEILKANIAKGCKQGYLVLTSALKSGSPDMVKMILDELKKPGSEEILKANLANRTVVGGFTALTSALMSGSPDIIKMILNELKKPEFEEILKTKLAESNEQGFMVLASALKIGSPVIVKMILDELKNPEFEEILKANLLGRTKAGFMPLQQAIKNGPVVNCERLVEVLKKYPEALESNLKNLSQDNFTILANLLCSFDNSKEILAKTALLVPLLQKYLSKNEQRNIFQQVTKSNYNILHHLGVIRDIEIFNLVIGALKQAFGSEAPKVLQQMTKLKNANGNFPRSLDRDIQKQLDSFSRWAPDSIDNSAESASALGVETQRDQRKAQSNKPNLKQKTEFLQGKARVKDTITLTTIDDAQAHLGEGWHKNMKNICYIMLPTTNQPPYRDLKEIVLDLKNNIPHDVKCVLMVGLNNKDNSQALIDDVAEFKNWYEKEFIPFEIHIDGFNWQVETEQDSKIIVPFGTIRNRILTSTLKHMNEKYADKDVTKILITLDSDTKINKKSFEDLFSGAVALEAGSLGYLYEKSSLRKRSISTGPLVEWANLLDMRLRKKLGDLGYLAECSLFMKGAIVEDLQARVVAVEQEKDLPLFSGGGAESRGLIKYCQLHNFRYGQHFDEQHAPMLSKIPSPDDIDWGALDGWQNKNQQQKYNAVKSILFNHPYSNANYRFFLNQLRFAINLPSTSCKELASIASKFYIPNLIAQNVNKNFEQLCESLFQSLNHNKLSLLLVKPESMSQEQYQKVIQACYDWGCVVSTFIKEEMGKLPLMREAIKFGQGTRVEQSLTEEVQSAQFGSRNMYYGSSKTLADEILKGRKRKQTQDNSLKRQRNAEVREDAPAILPQARIDNSSERQQQSSGKTTVNPPLLYSPGIKRKNSEQREAPKRVMTGSNLSSIRYLEPLEAAQRQAEIFARNITGIADPSAETGADEDMMNDAFEAHFKQSGKEGKGAYDNLITEQTRSEERAERKAQRDKLLNDLEQRRAERALREQQRKYAN